MSVLSALGFDTGRITKEGIRRLNLVTAALLAIQAVILLIISNAGPGSRPVTLGYTSRDPLSSAVNNQAGYLPASHHFFDISLLYIVAAALLLAALGHLLSVTAWRQTYESDLNNGLNRLRWRFSALTAGLVMAAIALLVGVSDLALLILIFGATAGSQFMALLSEQLTQRLRAGEKIKFWGGLMPALAAWLAIVIYIKSSYVYGAQTPAYVYVIPTIMLILFILTAAARYKQFKQRGAWADYMYAERAYIVLSLVSFTALTWLVYGWLLH
jgi:hypothetical protein